MFALTVRAPWGKNAYFNAETLWVRERERERKSRRKITTAVKLNPSGGVTLLSLWYMFIPSGDIFLCIP